MDRRLLAVPAAAFALAFAGTLAWFSGDDETKPRGLPAAAGGGWIVLSMSPGPGDPAPAFLARAAVDGSDLRPVTKGTNPPAPATAVDMGAAVSPDGTTVAFQRAVAGRAPRVFLVGIDGSHLRRLTRGPAVELDAAWSPDGRWIAFARRVRRRLDLFMCTPDGSRLTRLTRTAGDDEDFPTWSPDGRQVAFTRYPGGSDRHPGELWAMSAGGGLEERLLGGAHDHSFPDWSPDGRSIALTYDARVAVVRADGSGLRQLTRRGGEYKEMRPDWSPDGRRIVFSRDPGQVLVIGADGSHPARIRLDAPGSGAVWVP